ncbi:hypothetical protein BI364_01735 [Acidihalobacter yilgarnensis]|uniref:Uncharacterized protein n=1 Tax=Acidihalobacter yilgarnensis TaxID=2819280 RepID=A0A1D8IKA7_9GAMM|nr:hypothetical protein [Acidihalobacter yilgarnensis]AOU96896.1 hypothetical protein BI364_01735 [Acidihalobacter yilgarnensis]
MILSELLTYLDHHSGYPILDGSPAETLIKARTNSHANAYAGEIIACLADKLGVDSVDAALDERVRVINSLGRLRLKYMADDAPVDGFRMVEKVIAAIDSAFNEEALAKKGK